MSLRVRLLVSTLSSVGVWILVGCSVSVNSPARTVDQVGKIEAANVSVASRVEGETDASGIFVANAGANDIVVFTKSARGNVAPSYRISGKNTGLDIPYDVAFGRNGDLFVVNPGSGVPPNIVSSVTVYARGAVGNVSPVRTISGPNTLLNADASGAKSLAVGALGKLYVATYNGHVERVLIFAPGATGDVAPISVIELGRALGRRVGGAYLTVDPKNNLVVLYLFFPGGDSGIATFSGDGHHLLANLNRRAGYKYLGAIATDPRTGNVEVCDELHGDVLVFPPEPNGIVRPIAESRSAFCAAGIAVGELGNSYVVSNSKNSVTILGPEYKVIGTIAGSATTLQSPFGVALGPTK